MLVTFVTFVLASLFANLVVLAATPWLPLSLVLLVLTFPLTGAQQFLSLPVGVVMLVAALVGGFALWMAQLGWGLFGYSLDHQEDSTPVWSAWLGSLVAIVYIGLLIAKAQSEPAWWLVAAMALVVPTAINIYLDYGCQSWFLALRERIRVLLARTDPQVCD